VVARDDRQVKADRTGERGEFVDAVAPVVHPAQQADQDEAGLGQHLFGVKVDRIGVAQGGQVRQPQGGKLRFVGLPGGGENRQVRVSEGQRDDLGRGLLEVDRLGGAVDRAGFDAQQVHVSRRSPH
jgi:hypothetical protein